MHYAVVVALLAATSVSAASIPVTVGANGLLAFSPDNITASVGDVITFSFSPKNHSVTQSSFADPCTKLNATALDSGFMAVTSGVGATTFSVTVNDTNPLWFYCAQTSPVSHCHSGMVFAVNPTASKNFTTFQNNAKSGSSSDNSTSNSTYGGSSASGSASGSASSSTSTSGSSNAAVAISGNVAGLLSFVGLVAGLVF